MMKQEKILTLEDGILLLQEQAKKSAVSIEQILSILPGKGRLLILLAFSLPFCQPLQIPGLSVPFGIVIAFLGIRMIFGKHAWLPQYILRKKISSQILQKITRGILRCIKFLHRWIHPRFYWLCHHPMMLIITGIIITLLGCLLSLPLPIPLSNLTAAWAIFLIALGLLEDDGLFVLIGYFISVLTIIGFTMAAFSLNHLLA